MLELALILAGWAIAAGLAVWIVTQSPVAMGIAVLAVLSIFFLNPPPPQSEERDFRQCLC